MAVIPARVPLVLQAGAGRSWRQLAFVDRDLVTDAEHSAWANWQRPGEARVPRMPAPSSDLDAAEVRTAVGWVDGAHRTVRACWQERRARIEVDAHCHVDLDVRGVYLRHWAADLRGDPVATLLGPPLILSLALNDVFCLHASAVAHASLPGVVLFVGDSGAGKSTLARWLPGVGDWQRVADDVVPVALRDGQLVALPFYPQLKLGPANQYPAGTAQVRPVVAIIALQRGRGAAVLRLTDSARRVLTLARHTISSRLFSGERLAAHLVFCAEAGAAVRGFELGYGSGRQALPRLDELLSAVMAQNPREQEG